MTDLRIGAALDAAGERTSEDTLLRTGDLTTHGVIVGMTGSGKTGLGIVLIEECLAAGIPALAIDPKGDLTNLCLTFPRLATEDFEPWVNDSEVTASGISSTEFAAQQATTWRDGLADWAIGPEKIAGLRQQVDFDVYTPGSSAGRQVNIVGSLAAPDASTPSEDVADEIESLVTSLLSMIGVDADPLASREHVLLSAIILESWAAGRDLDLATLVANVQRPPMRKLGVLDLDTFFPASDRGTLAVRLNSLLASPGFATWLEGDPIDIDAMLRTPDGRPRCAIVTTSHLSDAQRQWVTTLILAKVVTWMRRQGGTSDLRALLYMDEVAGYLPPTANPPTKKPMLLLLKQARAFGLGVVLSTQNPVDVDYKALSNAGTWLIGRLQTEQDKSRLVDGLRSAAGSVDVAALGQAISNLGKRQFVVKRVGTDQPGLTTTRWAMSYLRGPLMREEITRLEELGLVAAGGEAAPTPNAADAASPSASVETATGPGQTTATTADDETPVAPTIAKGIPVSFLDPAATWAAAVGIGRGSRLQAAVFARVQLRYDDAKADLVHDEEYEAILVPVSAHPDPTDFVPVDYDDRDLHADPPDGAIYRLPPSEVGSTSWWTGLRKDLVDHLANARTVRILANPDLKLFSRVGEADEAFAARCAQAADERADAAITALQRKYETRLRRLRNRADSASGMASRAATQHEMQHGSAAQVTNLLGGLFGGRRSRSSIVTEARRAAASASRVEAARERASTAERAILDVEEDLRTEVIELDTAWSSKAAAIVPMEIPLEKTDVRVADLRLVWVPLP